MEQKEDKIHTMSYKMLLLTWLGLLCLTGFTAWVAGVDLGRYGLTVNILVASFKAGLVLFIFMHLKYESAFFRIILFIIIITLTAIMALTFLDVLYR